MTNETNNTPASAGDLVLALELAQSPSEVEAFRGAVELLNNPEANAAFAEALARPAAPWTDEGRAQAELNALDDYFEGSEAADNEEGAAPAEGVASAASGVAAPVSRSYFPLTAQFDALEFPDVKVKTAKDKEGKTKVVGATVLSTQRNLEWLLAQYGIEVRYNVMSKEEDVTIPGESFSSDNRGVASIAMLQSLCRLNAMPITELLSYVTAIAERNSYHPVKDWVLSKPWDGVSRLPEFLDTVGVDIAHIEHKNAVIRRWLVSAIAAVFCDTKAKFEGVLVFAGAQGVGKTSWFRKLVPSELNATMEGASVDPSNKDSVLNIVSHWMVELGEIGSTFRKSDVDRLKAFISDTEDQLRQAYATKKSHFKRRTVMFGSVNDNSYLTDTTGNRRWWTVPVTSINYQHSIDMQQLWAEVLQLYLAGEQWHLTEKEAALLNTVNSDHEQVNPVEEIVRAAFTFPEDDSYGIRLTASAIAKGLGLDAGSKRVTNDVADAVRKLTGKQASKCGRMGRYWVMHPVETSQFQFVAHAPL